jgi:uncharacterized protein YggU (UPF0235/DUF167 family)
MTEACRARMATSETGAVTVRVSAPPESGKANTAVIQAVADALGMPPSALEIVRCHTTRDKIVVVDGLTEDEVISRLKDSA